MIVTAGFAVVVFARYLPRPIAPQAEALAPARDRRVVRYDQVVRDDLD